MLLQAGVTWDFKIVLAIVFLILLLTWILYTLLAARRSPYPLPPGPPGKLLVGNLGQLSDQPEQDYIRWGKEYDSDVIHVNVLGQHMVCLNSVKAATDLLDRRGSNYCDRPRFTLFEIMGWGFTLTFLRWGPRFKLHRRLFQTTFNQTALKAFRPMQTSEARRAVRTLLTSPTNWVDTTLLLTTSVIFRIAYGQPVHSASSPYTAMSRAANAATSNGGIAGSSITDVLPFARHLLPSHVSPALKHARDSRETIRQIHEVPWRDTVADIEAGTASPSFMKTHFDRWTANARAGAFQEATLADLKGATAAVFIAGGNSTWGTVLAAMLYLTKYPEVQRRVQAELDAIVVGVDGANRLPEFEDRPRLPYLEAFMNETLRSLPLNPLVIPHRSRQDDVYEGMFIPAGTVVFANTKAMCSDPETYTDPETFDPSRYERGEPPPVGNFGFGRRKCPGNHLAMATVFVFVATLCSVFELERVVDEKGRVVEVEAALTVGLGGHPAPFECQLKLRSPERAALLREDRDFGEKS
ncbi:unnamed protein product [Discula destructiva]